MARFVLYLRRSSPGEEKKNYSIQDQERDIRERWADYHQHTLVKQYSDPGGKSYTLARPVLSSLMRDARDKLFDIVVVGRFDRFSRVQDQQSVAVYQLEQYGVKVVSATQPIPDGPIGTLIRNNYGFAAELELYNIRERTYSGKRSRVKDGKLPNQALPIYGYLFENPAAKAKERYIPDPEAAAVVAYIFDLALSGMKIRAIARRLDVEGVATPSRLWVSRGWTSARSVASSWSSATIHNILTNPAYIGKHVGFRTKIEEVEVRHPVTGEAEIVKRLVPRDEDDEDRVAYGSDICPPLLDEGRFYEIQALLKHNKEASSRNYRDPSGVLLRNGFAKCGYCSGNMVAQWSKADGQYRYFCSRASSRHDKECPGGRFSWRASELDDIVWRTVLRQFERPDIISAKYEQWKADRDDGRTMEQDRVVAIEKAIQDAEKRRKNNMLLAQNEDDDEMRAEYQLAAREAAKRVRELQQDLGVLQAQLASQSGHEDAIRSLAEAGEQALAQLRQFDYDSKRRTLFALRAELTVWAKSHPDQYAFGWSFGEIHDHVMAALGAEPSDSVQSHLWQYTQIAPRLTWSYAEIQRILATTTERVPA